GNPRTIHARTKAGIGDLINPTINVGFLLRQHSAAFFDIKKDDGLGGKALAFRRFDRGSAIGLAERFRTALQIFVQTSIEEHEKSETGLLEHGALPRPAIRVRARWVVEPITGVGEALPQCRKAGVARVVIAIKAKISRPLGENSERVANQQQAQKTTTMDTKLHEAMHRTRIFDYETLRKAG